MPFLFILLLTFETAALAALVFLLYKTRKQSRVLTAEVEEARTAIGERVRFAGEAKNRIVAILESMAEGVIVIDTDKKIVLINTVLADVLQLNKDQAVGRYFWEIFRDPEINEMIEKGLRERASLNREHSILLSDSIFEIQVSPVFGGRNFMGVVAVFHDVTRLKKLERMRSEFVANVSHELKTPLTSIMGFIETLKEGAMDDAQNRMHFLGIIEEHSRKLHDLIEDLLLLSKEESSGELIKKEKVELERVVERIFKLYGKAVKSKKINTRFEFSQTPFFVSADPPSLEQVLSNLVDNAIKYNKEGGEISVRASYEGRAAKIEISDTGIGIPEADIPRIFERFYRVDKSRSRESGGTGLGLSIAKHIVEKHGGFIQAKSAPPRGTTFTITLPEE